MPAISVLNAMLTASVAGFTAGMAEGGESAQTFGERFTRVAEGVTEALGIIGIGFSAEGAAEYLKNTFETVDANSKLAASLGVSTEALGRLEYSAKLAGVANEELTGGLTKMLKNIDGARDGEKGASEAFQKIGLNVKELAGLEPDQAFAKIGQALSQMTDPAARAHATMELFGKTGTSLLPILTEGADKLAAESAEADKFGEALNGVDSAKIENAHESIARVEGAIEGASNKLIVAMAPYLDIVAKKLVDVTQKGQGLGGYLVSGFEGVVKAVAAGADYLELFEAGFDTLKSGAEYAIAGIEFGFGALLNVAGKVLDYFHVSHDGLTEYAESVEQTHRQMMDNAAAAWGDAQKHVDAFANGENSQKVAALFDGITAGATAAAQATADAHEKMGALTADPDVTGADKKTQEAMKQMEEQGKRMWEETRTPAEKYQETLEKIQKMHAGGFIDDDTMAREMKKAQDDLDKTLNKMDKVKHFDVDAPKALVAGSSEAADFVAKFQTQGFENQHEAEVAENTKQANTHLAQMAKIMSAAKSVTVLNWGDA